MLAIKKFGVVLLLGSLTGCVVPPPLPPQVPFVALPGPAKTEAQFRQDDTVCRAASVRLPPDPVPARPSAAGTSAQTLNSQTANNQATGAQAGADLPPVPPGVSYLRCMEVRNNRIEPLTDVRPVLYAYYPAYPVYYRYGYPWYYPEYAFGFGYGFGYGYGFYGGRFGGYRGGYYGGYGGGFHGGGYGRGYGGAGYHGGGFQGGGHYGGPGHR